MTKSRQLSNSVNPDGLDGQLLEDQSVTGSKLNADVYGVAYVENFETGAGTNAALQAAIDSDFLVISAKEIINVNDITQLQLASGKTFVGMTIESTANSVNNGQCFVGDGVNDIRFVNCTFILKNRHRAVRFTGTCSNISFEGCKFISESPVGLLGYSAYALQIGDEIDPITDVKITNCFFDNCCGSAAVALREVTGAVVSSNTFKASISTPFNFPFYPTQVDLANGSDCTISNNIIEIPANAEGGNYFGYGIYQGDGAWDGLTVSDNVIKKIGLSVNGQSIGIKIGGGTNSINSVISENSISGEGLYGGIFLLNVDKALVSSNFIDDVIIYGIDIQQSIETTVTSNDITTASSGDAHGVRVGENFDYSLPSGLCVIEGNKIKKNNVGSGRGCIGFWRYHPKLVIKSNTLDAVDSMWVRSIYYGEKVYPGTSGDSKYGILTFSQDDNTLLTSGTIDYRNSTITVKDFGAKGDGVSDDTAAIRRALDYVGSKNGGKLIFPPGVYLVSSTIIIPRTNTSPVPNPSVAPPFSGLLITGFGACIKGTGPMANTTSTPGGTLFESGAQNYSTGGTSNFGFPETYLHYNTQIEGLRFENCGVALKVYNFLQGCAIRNCIFSNVKTYIYAERCFYAQFKDNCGLNTWRPPSGPYDDPNDAAYVFKAFVNVETIQGNSVVSNGPVGARGVGFYFAGGTSGLIAFNNSAERCDIGLWLGSAYYGALIHGWYFEGNQIAIAIRDGNGKRGLGIDGCWFNDVVALTAETWISGELGPNNYYYAGSVNINDPEGVAVNAALNTTTVYLPPRDYEPSQASSWTRVPVGWDIGGGVRLIQNDSFYNPASGPRAALAMQNASSNSGGPSKAYTAVSSGQGSFTLGVPFCVRTTNPTSIDFDTNIGYGSGYESGIRFDFAVIGPAPIGTRRLSGTISGTTVFRDDSDALTVTASNNSGKYRVTIEGFGSTSSVSVAGGIRVI